MSVTPTGAASRGTAVARLEIVRPQIADEQARRIPLRFNPTDYKLSKSNTFAEITIPGLESPPIQYIRGGSESLTVQALVDTSDTLDDVRKSYVDNIRKLMRPQQSLHARIVPPPPGRRARHRQSACAIEHRSNHGRARTAPQHTPASTFCEDGRKASPIG